jgi:hypothetical protein
MADLVKVTVLRAVGGYAEGDTRELSPADAKRLGDRGVVKAIGAAPQNKMEPAPQNKAERAPEKKQAERIDPNFLDRSVSAILPDLEGKSDAELRAIYDAEKHGKTRKSLMGPLNEMLEEKDS